MGERKPTTDEASSPSSDEPRSLRSGLPAWALVATIVLLGGLDFAFAMRRWTSITLTVALSILLVPWIVLVIRETTGSVDPRQRTSTQIALHLANTALTLVFGVAKWITLIDSQRDPSPATYVGSYRTYGAVLLLLVVVGTALRGGRVARFVKASTEHPARLMAVSFGVTSIIGALLLSLPISIRETATVSLVDSLFVSTSAVCVTGLSPIDVAGTYTFFGQAVLCLLIQVGGLGIMVITAAVTMLAGRRLGVKGAAALAEVVDSRSLQDMKRTVAMIVSYTLVFEAAGAGLLYFEFTHTEGTGLAPMHAYPFAHTESVEWAAVFHAVSAFCNAGFSNLPKGVSPFVGHPTIVLVLGSLVVLGGLGFPVIHELLFRWRHVLRRKRPPRLTLNTRVTLATTTLLLFGLTFAYIAIESESSFRHLSWLERIDAAVFQSISARTAGFGMVDMGKMRPVSLLLTCFAMFVGGGSGSIAGGIKVTTFAVLFATLRGELRGRHARLFDRQIPEAVVRRAIGVGFLAAIITFVVVLVILLIERQDPIFVLFETVSAFSTAGLSAGITANLAMTTKLILVTTMLVGRIGPLTAVLAISQRTVSSRYALPEERVMIG